MKYFLISYNWNLDGKYGFGDLTVIGPLFPKRTEIQKEISRLNGAETRIVIINIYQFPSKTEYKQFYGL